MVKNFDDRSPQLEGRLLPGNARETAAAYKKHFPWADESAMAISMGVNNAFHSQMVALQRFLTAEGIDHSQPRYTVLRILYFAEGGRKSLNEIRSEMAVTSGNVTFLADGLEKAGLARRAPHATDRRITELELTAEGTALAAAMVEAVARYMARTARGFSNAEMSLFRNFLERFHHNTLNILDGEE